MHAGKRWSSSCLFYYLKVRLAGVRHTDSDYPAVDPGRNRPHNATPKSNPLKGWAACQNAPLRIDHSNHQRLRANHFSPVAQTCSSRFPSYGKRLPRGGSRVKSAVERYTQAGWALDMLEKRDLPSITIDSDPLATDDTTGHIAGAHDCGNAIFPSDN